MTWEFSEQAKLVRDRLISRVNDERKVRAAGFIVAGSTVEHAARAVGVPVDEVRVWLAEDAVQAYFWLCQCERLRSLMESAAHSAALRSEVPEELRH